MASWFSVMAGGTRGRLLGLMRRSRRSINELAAALGVTDNAVRAHVAAMQREGMVRVAGAEPTGGKPAQLYEITPEAEELFPKAYAAVLGELIRLLEEREGRAGVEALLREVGRRAAGADPDADADADARVRRAAETLRALGGEVEVVGDGAGWVIRGAGCPLSSVVRDHPAACRLAESLVEEATGLPTEERCERGDRPRCVFRVEGPGTFR